MTEKDHEHVWTLYENEECDICGWHIGTKCVNCGKIKVEDEEEKDGKDSHDISSTSH